MDKKYIQEKIGREISVSDLMRTGNKLIKLGADKGSGFVYCGDISAMDPSAIDEELLGGCRKVCASAEKRIRTAKETPRTYKHFRELCERKIAREIAAREKEEEAVLTEAERSKVRKELKATRKKHAKYLEKLDASLKTAEKTLINTRWKIENYTPLASRTITDIYASVDEIGVVIALFDGIEHGAAWTTEEFEELKNKGSNSYRY